MARLFCVVVAMAATCALFGASNGSADVDRLHEGRAKVVASAEEAIARLSDLQLGLKLTPPKLDPSRWNAIGEAAAEVKATVNKLIELRQRVLSGVDEMGSATGQLRTELAALQRLYQQLSSEAKEQISGSSGGEPLVPKLLEIAEAESSGWSAWSDVCVEMAKQFEQLFSTARDDLKLVEQSGPMLSRFQRGADGIIELAKLAQRGQEQMAALGQFAQGLNSVISAFEGLATSTSSIALELGLQDTDSLSNATEVEGAKQVATRKGDGGYKRTYSGNPSGN